jgi:hypothetical protein
VKTTASAVGNVILTWNGPRVGDSNFCSIAYVQHCVCAYVRWLLLKVSGCCRAHLRNLTGLAKCFNVHVQVFGSIRRTVNGTLLKSAPEFNGEGATYVINKYFIVPPGEAQQPGAICKDRRHLFNGLQQIPFCAEERQRGLHQSL